MWPWVGSEGASERACVRDVCAEPAAREPGCGKEQVRVRDVCVRPVFAGLMGRGRLWRERALLARGCCEWIVPTK